MRDYLKNLRELNGMTMQAVADKIGISKQYYQMIESGERQKKMDFTLMTAISSAFAIPIEQIVEEEQALISGRKGSMMH